MINDLIEIIIDRFNNINKLYIYTNYNNTSYFIDLYVGDQHKHACWIDIDKHKCDSFMCHIRSDFNVHNDLNKIIYSVHDFVDVDEFVGLILCRMFYG